MPLGSIFGTITYTIAAFYSILWLLRFPTSVHQISVGVVFVEDSTTPCVIPGDLSCQVKMLKCSNVTIYQMNSDICYSLIKSGTAYKFGPIHLITWPIVETMHNRSDANDTFN